MSSDDDGIECKRKIKTNIIKSPRKKKLTKPNDSHEVANNNKAMSTSVTSLENEKTQAKSTKSATNVNEQKSPEKMDWDCNSSAEDVDMRSSPEHVSAGGINNKLLH